MSIVLVIIGLLTATLFPALLALKQAGAQSATDIRLQTLTRATAAYAETRGCLPCPTPPLTSGAGFGVVRGDASAAPQACEGCQTPEGLVPFLSLGLPMNAAKDGWGHWITMRIDPDLAADFRVIPPTAPCTQNDVDQGICTVLNAAQKGLCGAKVSQGAKYPVVTLPEGSAAYAAVVFVSHGSNGFGAFEAHPLYAAGKYIHRLGVKNGTTPTCAAGSEACNASYTTAFVDDAPSLSYDDRLVFLSRDALLSLLGQPSCQTPWPF